MNLASVEKIKEIFPIKDADKIELARILGYQSVVVKGAHHAGDLVAFINPDTLVKRAAWNKFLWPKGDENEAGADIRIRTLRLRGQLSEGLVVNLTNFKDIPFIEGSDISEKLGVSKYEKPIKNTSIAKGNYPTNILPMTDEPRIKNFPNVFNQIEDKEIVVRLKYDGSSSLFILNNGEFNVGSRQLLLKDSESDQFWRMAKKYHIEDKLRGFGRNIAINAECVGPKINGNTMKLTCYDLAVFNGFDIDQRRYLNNNELEELCDKLGLPIAKLLYKGKNKWNNIQELQEWVNSINYDCGDPAEGVVVRTSVEEYSPILRGRFSFKVLNENFLLKHKE